jgi:hypothetical protein
MNHDVLYLVIRFLDRVLYYLSCGQFEYILAGYLMRYLSSQPSTSTSDRNNFLRNMFLSDDTSGQSSSQQQHRHPRVDLTSQETSSSEYEINGILKESYDECSIVIC